MSLDSTHLVTIILGVALTYGSATVIKAWIQSRENMHEREIGMKEKVALSALETKRLELLARITQWDERLVT